MKRTFTILSALMLIQNPFVLADAEETAEPELTAAEEEALKAKEKELVEQLAQLR